MNQWCFAPVAFISCHPLPERGLPGPAVPDSHASPSLSRKGRLARHGPRQEQVLPPGRAAPFSSLAQVVAGSGTWNCSPLSCVITCSVDLPPTRHH